MANSRSGNGREKPELVISLRPGVDWLSLALAFLIGIVFHYANIRVPW
jgi:hypothetical protein